MSSAFRQLSTSARSSSRPLTSAAHSATRASRYYHAAAPGTGRILGPVTVVAPRAGARGYRLRAGDEDLSEESKKSLDKDTKLKLGKSKSLDPHRTFLLPAQANALSQPYPFSKTAFRLFSNSRSPTRFSPPTSPSTSSPPPTRTSPSPTAGPPTKPPSGPRPSPGTASR